MKGIYEKKDEVVMLRENFAKCWKPNCGNQIMLCVGFSFMLGSCGLLIASLQGGGLECLGAATGSAVITTFVLWVGGLSKQASLSNSLKWFLGMFFALGMFSLIGNVVGDNYARDQAESQLMKDITTGVTGYLASYTILNAIYTIGYDHKKATEKCFWRKFLGAIQFPFFLLLKLCPRCKTVSFGEFFNTDTKSFQLFRDVSAEREQESEKRRDARIQEQYKRKMDGLPKSSKWRAGIGAHKTSRFGGKMQSKKQGETGESSARRRLLHVPVHATRLHAYQLAGAAI